MRQAINRGMRGEKGRNVICAIEYENETQK